MKFRILKKIFSHYLFKNWKWLTAILILVIWIASVFLIPIFSNQFFGMPDKTNYGEIGDMFGAVNALFSGFAFLGLIIAISLQRKELKEQRKDIALQREDIKIQNEALQEQKKELELTRQEFEINRITNIIYKQLDKIELITNNFQYVPYEYRGHKQYKGFDALEKFYYQITKKNVFLNYLELSVFFNKNKDTNVFNEVIEDIEFNSSYLERLFEHIVSSSYIVVGLIAKIDSEIQKDLNYIYFNNFPPYLISLIEYVTDYLRYSDTTNRLSVELLKLYGFCVNLEDVFMENSEE